MYRNSIFRTLKKCFCFFILVMCITFTLNGCTTIPKSIVRNTIGVVERVPGVDFFIGGTSDMIINTMEIVENEIIVRDVINVSETITAETLYGGKSWDKLRKRLGNPHKVALFLNTLDYKEEQEGQNHTQTPDETVRRGGGDCEDFAYIVVDTLSYHGYETRMLSVWGNNTDSHHAVGIYKEKTRDKWHYIEKSEVSKGFETISILARHVAKDYYGSFEDYNVFSTAEEFIQYYDD